LEKATQKAQNSEDPTSSVKKLVWQFFSILASIRFSFICNKHVNRKDIFLLSSYPALTPPLPTLGYHITFIASLYFSSLCVAGLGS
jgi:hypothetical protein